MDVIYFDEKIIRIFIGYIFIFDLCFLIKWKYFCLIKNFGGSNILFFLNMKRWYILENCYVFFILKVGLFRIEDMFILLELFGILVELFYEG